MNRPKNKPLAALQPAPAFANDPAGFWGGVMAQNATAGLSSVLPVGTVNQSDTAIKGRLLAAQIGWQPTQARWNGAVFPISISDAQFLLAVEDGGSTQQGRLTALVSKSVFGRTFPGYNETIGVLAAGSWHEFLIAEIVGQHDDNEPALTFFLEKDQDGNGD